MTAAASIAAPTRRARFVAITVFLLESCIAGESSLRGQACCVWVRVLFGASAECQFRCDEPRHRRSCELRGCDASHQVPDRLLAQLVWRALHCRIRQREGSTEVLRV